MKSSSSMATNLRHCVMLACWALSLGASGCEGFGRELVGRNPDGGRAPGANACKFGAPTCSSAPVVSPLVPPGPPMFALARCGDLGATCDPAATSTGSIQSCDLNLTLNATTATSLKSLSCARVAFDVSESVRLNELSLSQIELTLSSSTPVTVELARSKLELLRVELRGPITLRISESSQILNAQFRDSSTTGASLELSESQLDAVSAIGFRGPIAVERSHLQGTQLFGSAVTIEASFSENTSVAADRFIGVEVEARDMTLETGAGTLSGASMRRLRLQRCDTMLISNSDLYDSTLVACSNALRTDSGTVTNATVFGTIISHTTYWDECAFGAGVPTTFASWQDGITNSRFCDGTGLVTLGDVTALSCNDCTSVAEPPEQLFCAVPDAALPPTPADFIPGPDPTSDAGIYNANRNNPLCPILRKPPDCDPVPDDPYPL